MYVETDPTGPTSGQIFITIDVKGQCECLVVSSLSYRSVLDKKTRPGPLKVFSCV